jgi:hypothetical protein
MAGSGDTGQLLISTIRSPLAVREAIVAIRADCANILLCKQWEISPFTIGIWKCNTSRHATTHGASPVSIGFHREQHIQPEGNKKSEWKLCETDSDWSDLWGKGQVEFINWRWSILVAFQRKRGLIYI